MKGRRKERTKEIKKEELKKERKLSLLDPTIEFFQAKARTRRGHANDNSFSFSFRKLMAFCWD
jgi:hypothetical protein